MSIVFEKVKGKAEVVAGVVEKALGKAVGNEKLEAAGVAMENKGESRQDVAAAAGLVKDAAKEVTDAISDVREKAADMGKSDGAEPSSPKT